MSKTYSVRVHCLNCGEGTGGKGLGPYSVDIPKGMAVTDFLAANDAGLCRNCGCRKLVQRP